MKTDVKRAQRVAGIDVGSNTLLVLIADIGPSGEMTVVRDECRFGRLGQGVGATGRLAADAVKRCLEIADEFRGLLDEYKPDRIAAVGTQALRAASNANDFLKPAESTLGVPVEVISGEREAELTYLATAASFPELASVGLVLADVGGASTEVVCGTGTELQTAVSVPIGAVSLAEKHLTSDPPTAEQTRALFADIDGAISELELRSATGTPLIGTAGTSTTFATVELKMTSYDGDRVQGLRLPRTRIDWHVARFLELSVAEKKKLVGLEPQRADVIAAGAAIYARLMAKMKAPEFIVSGRGVRFGVCAELAAG